MIDFDNNNPNAYGVNAMTAFFVATVVLMLGSWAMDVIFCAAATYNPASWIFRFVLKPSPLYIAPVMLGFGYFNRTIYGVFASLAIMAFQLVEMAWLILSVR